MTILEQIEKRLSEVGFVKGYAEAIIRSSKPGTLRFCYANGRLKYFSRISQKDNNGIYLDRKSSEVIKELQYKAYMQELIKVLEKEESELKKIKKLYEDMPVYENVFLSMPLEKRSMIIPFEYRDVCKNLAVEKISDWKKKYIMNSDLIKKSLKTQNGEYVRSKSELIIADHLKAAEVPYVYEKVLKLDKRIIKPDFMVINTKTGKQYYWEHLGMLDDPEYCFDCLEKIEKYSRYGYYPGKNLIITMESKRHPLSTVYIDDIINEYLK